MKKMKTIKTISCGAILILLVGIIAIYKTEAFTQKNNQSKENNPIIEDGIVTLNSTQIEQIDKKLKENSCEMIGLFYPLVERKLNFQNFETRISAIRNYIHGKQLTEKLDSKSDKIIWKNLGGVLSDNMLIEINFLSDYYQKLFGESLDKDQLNPEKIYEGNYYDTGEIPCGGCVDYTPVLNKIEYEKATNTYTIFIVDLTMAPESYKNTKQLTDEEIEKNNLKDKIGLLKISFKWINNQVVLKSTESNPIPYSNPNQTTETNVQEQTNTNNIQTSGNSTTNQNNTQTNPINDKLVTLTNTQINQIDKNLKENSCEMIGLFYPLVERKLDFNDFETRISAIRNYVIDKQIKGIIGKNTDKIISKDLGDIVSSNTLLEINFLKDYYQRIFKEELDEKHLDSKKIYEEKYYDTGIVPGGGCLLYTPVLNKIEYEKATDTYTILILDLSKAPDNYKNVKQLTDEEIEKNNLKEKLGLLKISFKWTNNQVILKSTESHPIPY